MCRIYNNYQLPNNGFLSNHGHLCNNGYLSQNGYMSNNWYLSNNGYVSNHVYMSNIGQLSMYTCLIVDTCLTMDTVLIVVTEANRVEGFLWVVPCHQPQVPLCHPCYHGSKQSTRGPRWRLETSMVLDRFLINFWPLGEAFRGPLEAQVGLLNFLKISVTSLNFDFFSIIFKKKV